MRLACDHAAGALIPNGPLSSHCSDCQPPAGPPALATPVSLGTNAALASSRAPADGANARAAVPATASVALRRSREKWARNAGGGVLPTETVAVVSELHHTQRTGTRRAHKSRDTRGSPCARAAAARALR